MILIIDKSRKNGNSLADAFKYMGIIARAETPDKATSELSTFYRFIIISDPGTLPDEREYVRLLHSYLADVPILALTSGATDGGMPYDLTVSDKRPPAALYRLICGFCRERGIRPPGDYLMSGIDASVDLGFVTYFSEVVTLTRTESMILRVLMRTYPSPMKPSDILKYAFSQSKLPDPTSIRTHICAINKKFRVFSGRNQIVSTDSGYVIMTAALAKEAPFTYNSAK